MKKITEQRKSVRFDVEGDILTAFDEKCKKDRRTRSAALIVLMEEYIEKPTKTK